MRRLTAMAACVGLLAAGTAACGTPPPATPRTAPLETAATTAAAPSTAATGLPAPLTGLPVSAAVVRRPVLAVAVASEPAPRGLDRADVVVEELTSPIRYVALFQSRDAASVGPVAQTRPMDAQLLAVGHPAVAYAGGREGFVTRLREAGAVDLGYPSLPEFYQAEGSALYTSTAALFARASGASPATPSLSFAQPGQPLATGGALPARDVTVSPPGSAAQRWVYVPAAKAWQGSARGLRVSNVIFQEVEYKQIEPFRGSNAVVPSAVVLGSGRCTVLSGQSAVPCTWLRKGTLQLTNYLDPAGVPLRLAPGMTWLLLVPAGSTVTRR